MPFAIQSFVVDDYAVRRGGLTEDRLREVWESGSYKAPLAGGYKAFSTTFTATPEVSIDPLAVHDLPPRLVRISAGSFQATGTPGNAYIRYVAHGARAAN